MKERMVLQDVKGGGIDFTAEPQKDCIVIEFLMFFGFTVRADKKSVIECAEKLLAMAREKEV